MSLIDDLNKDDKATAKTATEPKNPKSASKGDDDGTTKVPTNMLETLQQQLEEQAAQIKKLEKRQINNEEIDEDDDEAMDRDIVRLRKFEPNGIVIGYNKARGTWVKYDKERGEDILMIELLVRDEKGEERKEETPAQFFFENAKEIEFPVIKRESKKTVTKTGKTTIKLVPTGEYKTVDTGKKIQQKVVTIESKALVEMPDGEQLLIDTDFLNM